MKKIFSFLTALFFVGSIMATESSITFSELGLENGVQYTDPFVIDENVSITFAGGGNDGKYYDTGTGIRTYGGGTITIAAASSTISEIAFTWSGSNSPDADVATPQGYSTSTKKWTGTGATSVVLTRPSGSGHWRLQSVTVTYGSSVPTAVTGVTLDKNKDTVAIGKTITLTPIVAPSNATNKAVTWESDDEDIATVEDGVVTGVAEGTATITVTTEDGSFTAICEVTVIAAPVAASYELVTDATDLADGDEIIIVNNGATKAISTTQANNNRLAANVTAIDNVITPDGDVQILTLGKSNENWTLYTGSGYLYAASGSANHLKTQTINNANGEWTIVISNDVATLTAQGTNSHNVMQYNSGSDIFACYGSASQTSLKIFKKAGDAPAVTKPIITGAETFYDSTKVSIACHTKESVIYYTLDGSTPDETSTLYTDTFVLKNTTTVKAIAIKGNDTTDVVEKTFTKLEKITCIDVYSLNKGDLAVLNDIIVTFTNGKNVWVKDETASMLVYLPADGTFKAGDVLSGVAGVVDIFNGVTEVKPSAEQVAAITVTEGEAPAPVELNAITANDVNKYIILKNVQAEGEFTEGIQSNIIIAGITFRNQFKNGYIFTSGKEYDIEGVVSIYISNPQVYFITAVEQSSTPTELENIFENKAIKVIEDNKIVIKRNNIKYNILGQSL